MWVDKRRENNSDDDDEVIGPPSKAACSTVCQRLWQSFAARRRCSNGRICGRGKTYSKERRNWPHQQ
ncbi:hypothetical protein MTO96_029942 [Rhipicephalus appendiculatus]